METQSNKIDDEEEKSTKDDVDNGSQNTDQRDRSHSDIDNSPENTDNIHRSEGDIENGAENMDIVEKNVQEIRGHLDVKDIKSSDSDVLVPSSNAAIAGLSSILYNTSDTTFDDSVATVNTYNKSVDNITSDHSYIKSAEVTDRVVQSASAENIVMENNSNKIDEKQNSEVTGENISPLKPDVTQSESTMEFSTHSMDTEKSSYKESDAVTSESRDSNIS